MKINLPTQFNISYPLKNIKYYSSSGKRKIARLLFSGCQGYCMYCGKTVNIEGDRSFHLEHSVDKDGNDGQEEDPFEVLKHCKYNLAIACAECNTVCKKMVDKVDLKKYSPINKCPSTCNNMCDFYISIREDYMKKNAIILQPEGRRNPVNHLIAYNLLKHIYEPSGVEGQDEVNFFVQNHIDRFELNGRRFSPCVIDICCKVVSLYDKGIKRVGNIIDELEETTYFNILGIQFVSFIDNLFRTKEIDDLVEFCKMLVILDAVP